MNYASFLGRGFSIVTTLGRTRGRAADLVDRYGMQARCRGIHSCEIPVLELDRDPDARKVILEACFDALEQDDSDVLVLGCAGMADLCQDLSDELGVPVVDGVAAGVTMVSVVGHPRTVDQFARRVRTATSQELHRYTDTVLAVSVPERESNTCHQQRQDREQYSSPD